MVVGLLTATHCAAGNALAALPTVNVTGPQLALRLSEGCMTPRLAPLRNSRGVPSHWPIRQIAVGLGRVEVMFCPDSAVFAVTVTERVATSSSPWYSTWV